MKNNERTANIALAACLTVCIGCCPSVKPIPSSETMSNEHAMCFPFVGSAMLLSLFLLFKFLSKDLVNAVLTCYFFVLGIIALSSLTVAAIPVNFFCELYAAKKHWLANNILGLAFCIQGVEMLSLGSFKTGTILLAGLFVYDIFWVFFTPVMLLFPTADSAQPFSIVGLGDIVIPGIFVALGLRFDVSRGKDSQYFKSAFLGYTFGLVLTIIVKNWFQAAQPALLYGSWILSCSCPLEWCSETGLLGTLDNLLQFWIFLLTSSSMNLKLLQPASQEGGKANSEKKVE